MKNLITKKSARIAAAALAATVTFGATAFALSYKPAADSYTIASEDGGYYSETTYYLTEEAFGEYESGKQAGKPAAKTMSASAKNTSESEQESGEFVMGVAKSVWVMEELDEDGNVVDSQLLTKDEMDDYGISPNKVSPWFDKKINIDGGGYEKIGENTYREQCLTIELVVKYDAATKEYIANSDACWDRNFTFFWESGSEAESFTEDFIGLTWGGFATLEAQEYSIKGNYYDSNSQIHFRQSICDSYNGFGWYFYEQSSFLFGTELESAAATVRLKKVGQIQGGKTNVKLTYAHTYSTLSISAGLGVSTNGLAPAITLSGTEKFWDISIDVKGLEY